MKMNFIVPALISLSTVFCSTAATAQETQFDDPLLAQICAGDRERVQDNINLIYLASAALAKSIDSSEKVIFQGYIDKSRKRIGSIVDKSSEGCFYNMMGQLEVILKP